MGRRAEDLILRSLVLRKRADALAMKGGSYDAQQAVQADVAAVVAWSNAALERMARALDAARLVLSSQPARDE